MKIAILNAYKGETHCTHWNGIRWAAEQLGVDFYELDCRFYDKNQIIERLKDFDPDILIYGLTDPFYKNWYKEIREYCKGKIVMYYCDYRDGDTGDCFEFDLENYIDYFCVSNDEQKEFWKERVGVEGHFVAQAGTPVETFPEEDDGFDVVFIGVISSHGFLVPRAELLTEIREGLPEDINFEHINKGPLEERMDVFRQMPEIYGKSKICLDASHIWDAKKYTSNRYYVIANYGGFSVCKRFPGCEELFPEKVGKVYYDTAKEAIELIKYYIDKPEERKKIAKAGWEHAKKYHTYKNRLKDIIKICSN